MGLLWRMMTCEGIESHQDVLLCELPKLGHDVVPQCQVEHIEAAQVHLQLGMCISG